MYDFYNEILDIMNQAKKEEIEKFNKEKEPLIEKIKEGIKINAQNGLDFFVVNFLL